ncbi:tRNA/rRNA methyltransferase [hydrothermal vent metagenome]|uniref:tRNA/rRNA methyltransferase n=1 Tax=hydrothermal vent metagenome TaxID=652676 RepID=A0A3B0UH07_9ZZZZ
MRKLLNEELGRLDVAAFKKATKIPIKVVLDNVRSLNNIGSAFRTSDAFRVEAVYLCGITARPPHREIQKTALGATESVEWEYFATTANAVDNLRAEDYQIIVVEQADESVELQEFKINVDKKYALVFGNEVKGVDEKIVKDADEVVEIPQFGTKHSLNIAVSIGVVLWGLWVKFQKTDK